MSGISSRALVSLLALAASTGIAVGQQVMTASPSSLTFAYPVGSSTPVTQTFQLSAPVTANYTTSFSPGTLAGYFLSPAGGQVSATPSTVSITLQYPVFNTLTQGSLILTPAAGSGLSPLTIPLTINPGGSGGSTSIVATPSAVSFAYPLGTTTAQTVVLSITAPQTVSLAATLSGNLASAISVSSPITSNSTIVVSLPSPQSFAAITTGTLTLTPPGGSGLGALTIPITINPGGGSGSTSIVASPNALTYNYPVGTTAAQPLSLILTAPETVTLAASFTGNIANAFSITSPITSNSTVTVSLLSPASFATTTSGTLTLTPASGSTLGPIAIPITINPGGSSSTGLTATPNTLTYTYAPGTTTQQVVFLQLTAPTSVALTPSFSANIASSFTVPSSINSNSQIPVTLVFPQFVTPGTIGSLTLTPAAGSGLSAITIPIFVNTTGGGTGILVPTPSSLTFGAQVGGAAPAAQSVTVTAADNSATFFTTSVSSTTPWLTVSQSTFTTPATLTVRVDPAQLTSTGTFTGTISLAPLSGALAATISVTVNVASNVTVTPNPSSVSLTAAAGSPTAAQATVQISSSDQTLAFTAQATTTSGGNWLSVTPTSGTLGAALAISASAASLSTGTYQGSVALTAQNVVVATIPVTLTVTTAASLNLSSSALTFNHQTTSSSAPPPQAVQITSSGATLNWTASATSTGGWLQATPASGTTPGSLNVSVVPTGLSAGTYTGSISVASSGATNTPQTITVTLNVTTPAIPLLTSVVNGASFAPTVAVPGEIITIRGTDLGPATGVSGTVDAQGFLSTTVSGVRVLFDGTAAPILYASATQINAVVPYEIANRVSTRLQVQAQNQTSRELELRVGETAPGLFAASQSGSGQAAAVNQNGTINTSSNPERRGNIISLFGTGMGQTNPSGTTGLVMAPGAPLRTSVAPVSVRIGGQPAQVTYAGGAPGAVSGGFQINVRIPENVGTGSLPVEVQIGSLTSQAAVTIAVQ